MESHVVDFFKDKSVLITGGTGFLGVSLIEKLLRSCSHLKSIYVLIRPKKGKTVEERLEELTKNSVFDILRKEEKTDLFKKLISVIGDVGEENLGLSSRDRLNLVEHVQVVFHSAATLDFEADLKSTVSTNLLGTRRVIELCKEIRDLKALVHVSSAYVNSEICEVHEEIYPAPADVNEVLKLVKQLSDDELKKETPRIINAHANPYTFTKHLAEYEILNGKLPSAIVRPSMITGAWKEPIPGWTISKNGPQGFLMGASKGVVRRLPVSPSIVYDYIPVDIVVNHLIVAAYAIDRDSAKEVKVYHCTSSTCNPFKWTHIDSINDYLHIYPLCSAIWYPYLKFIPSLFLFKISALFVHLIPAYILDTFTRLCGGRPVLVRLHTNVNKSLDRLEKFIFTEWKFHNPCTLKLHESLSSVDKDTFTLDITKLEWRNYFLELTKGVRQYLHNESPRSLSRARSKDKMLMIAHLVLQASLLGLVWWIAKVLIGTTWTNTGLFVPITYLLFNQL